MKPIKTAGIISGTASLAAKHPVAAVGTALAGTAAVRGALHAGDQAKQVREHIEAAKKDVSTPVRKFAEAWNAKVASVSARYDRSAEHQMTKVAAMPGMPTPPSQPFTNEMFSTFGGAALKTIANKLFAAPITKAFDILDKKLYLEPKQRNVLQQVLQSDPMLARAMQETPEIVLGAYKTIKQFAPSLSTDANALKNFLKQAVALGGQLDPMTVKLLAETEYQIRRSRGQIAGGERE